MQRAMLCRRRSTPISIARTSFRTKRRGRRTAPRPRRRVPLSDPRRAYARGVPNGRHRRRACDCTPHIDTSDVCRSRPAWLQRSTAPAETVLGRPLDLPVAHNPARGRPSCRGRSDPRDRLPSSVTAWLAAGWFSILNRGRSGQRARWWLEPRETFRSPAAS
jgi:hypothetical protein